MRSLGDIHVPTGSDIVSLGAGCVNVKVLGVGMFEGRKLTDLLSFGEWF